MIIFHEGLPRSGKSYSAMCDRIIPALQQGRAVCAYIEGLDYERIAQAAGLDVERVRALLTAVVADDVHRIDELAPNSSLVIIDEAQDFFGNKVKLSDSITKFVTQHGHRGIDIVLMGQDMRDVHVLWRRRVEIKQEFLKLSGVGKENSFSVNTYRKSAGSDNFQKVTFKIYSYDQKYFGTYASHVDSSVNTGNYKDAKATIWGSQTFVKWLPLAAVVAVLGVWYLWGFFKGDRLAKPAKPAQVAVADAVARPPAPVASAVAVVPKGGLPAAPVASGPVDPVEARLTGLTVASQVRYAGGLAMHGKSNGVVEWWDQGSSRVVERMTVAQLEAVGVKVERVGDFSVKLRYGGWSVWATMWPVESSGRVSDDRQQQVKDVGQKAQADNQPPTVKTGNLG